MEFEKTQWRLMITPPAQGDWNMALDEALLESVGRHESLPVLRLYGWNPPCLSLGYAQPFNDVDLDQLHTRGWGLVRRPTGGRAVLHADELTYSIIAPQDEPRVAGSIIESYRCLSAALLKALQLLNLPAQADKEYELPAGSSKTGAVCFEVPSNYEITIDGKKLIGSAQARKHHGVLQHGALPLCGDLTRILQVLKFQDEDSRLSAAKRLLSHATTVESVLGTIIPPEKAIYAFQQAFSATLNIDFIPSQPSSHELIRIEELIKEKFDNQDWLQHV